MSRIINWGIIGLGNIAHQFANDLNLFKGANLYAVASRSSDKAKEFAQKYKSNKYYDSYESLAKDPDIDVVYIATPHTFHFENTTLCLKEGKSVLCEKPMGINTMQVKIMVAEAKSRNLFLMEALWTRFIPSTQKVLELLGSNVIGNVNSIKADFGFKGDTDPNHRIYNKKLGGGSLLDVGIYPIYFSLLTLGMPNNIKAKALMTRTEVDSNCSMSFDYNNGAKAILDSNIEVNRPIEAYIEGEKGSIKIHSPFHHSKKITLFQKGKPDEEFEINYKGNGYYHEIEEVTKCLLNSTQESKKMPHSDSLNLITIIDRIKQEIGLKYDADMQ